MAARARANATKANQTDVSNSPGEVLEWAEGQSWEALECRKRGNHHMDYYRAWYDEEIRAFREILRCKCCKAATRESIISADDGSLIERGPLRYEDKSYLRPAGSGRLDDRGKNAIRLMVIQHRAERTGRRAKLRRVG